MSWSDSANVTAASPRTSLAISQGSTAVQNAFSTPTSQASSIVVPLEDIVPTRSIKNKFNQKRALRSMTFWKRSIPNQRPSNYWRLRHYSANGDFEQVKVAVDEAIKEGIDLDATGEDNLTALYRALLGGHFRIAQLLIDSGANVNPPRYNYFISLMSKKDVGTFPHFEIADPTHPEKINENFWPIFYFLRRNGAVMENRDQRGRTPLIKAAQQGYAAICQGLLNYGADLNAKESNYGLTAFVWASKGGHTVTCKVLLEEGASLLATDSYRALALNEAAKLGNSKICQLILRYADGVEPVDRSGTTALAYAAERGHDDTCRVLLSFGANAGTITDRQTTALHEATLRSHISTIKILLQAGTDPNVKDEDGLTPLHIAALNNQVSAAKLLLDHGADVNVESPGKRVPLAFAVSSFNPLLVHLLLEEGANPYAEDQGGWSPWKGAVLSAVLGETMWRCKRMERIKELMLAS